MKKGFRILSLVLAAVMIFTAACPTAFAKTSANIYSDASSKPHSSSYLNSVGKYTFTAEQGAGYILDLLDNLLRKANIKMENYQVLDEWYADAYLTVRIDNIDNLLWTLYNAVHGVADANKECLNNIIAVDIFGGISASGVLDTVVGMLDLGDVEELDVSALGNQNNSIERVCRNVPVKSNTLASRDLAVLLELTQFLSDNRAILKKLPLGQLDFGILDSTIKGIDGAGELLSDFPNALKNILYPILINSEADEAPSGWTYDAGVQQIVDWLLIDGTGDTADTGANSVLGANFEAFLPAIADQPGAASLTAVPVEADRGEGVKSYTMNFYQLVSNAINALLGGMVADLLEGVLVDALGIDETVNDGKGDTAIMSDVMFSTIIGAIETLCTANGAPAIEYTDDEQTYPIPKIKKLLDWFFNGGGLYTFVQIDYSGVKITDNLMSLLNDVIRILPGLFPLLGFSVPKGLTYTTDEMTELYFDSNGDPVYLTYEGEEIRIPDPENYPDDYVYVSNGNTVNTTDPTGADYRNPKFIRQKYVLSNDQIYAALIKIVLNSFIDGCYFPEWADSIASVAAYALASLAAQYIPENDYFDRLDAYHYIVEEGETYTAKGTTSVQPLAYVEEITLTDGTVAHIPRAAMNIGMSVLAYIIDGWQNFRSALGYTPQTDTSFEVYALEFLIWGGSQFASAFVGRMNSSTHRFVALSGGANSVWTTAFNNALAKFDALLAQYPNTGTATSTICNIPGEKAGEILFELIDNTIFTILPLNWLPSWVEDNGSQGLVYDWLLDSLVHFDLQKLLSLLSTNDNGELGKNAPIKIIINILDRIFGTLFGGNPVLPQSGRNIYTTATSVNTLEELLAGDGSNIAFLIENLLYYLNLYLPVLAENIFPIIMLIVGTKMKASTYYADADATTLTNGLKTSDQITYQMLKDYIDALDADDNSQVWYGTQDYSTAAKASAVADAIGANGYTTATVNGSTVYRVEFPEYYAFGTDCRNAAKYIANSEARSERRDGKFVHQLYVVDNYRTESSTETDAPDYDANGNIIQHNYTYTNIQRAAVQLAAGTGLQRYQSGTHGEVQFGSGYKAFGREDFRANNIYYFNRFEDATHDAEDLLGDIDTYAEKTLPNAYHDWLMYYVKCQLVTANLYDKNEDGTVDQNDGNPGVPSSPYPFYKTSGSTTEFSYAYDGYDPNITVTDYNRVWNFNYYSSNNEIIKKALEYADLTEEDGTNHDVVFANNEVQLIVRLALGTLSFDITKEGCWTALSQANLDTISNKCTQLGLVFDQTEHTITSKSFALIGSSLAGSTYFGSYIEWSGNDTDGYTSTKTLMSLTPAASTYVGPEGVQNTLNDIQKQYLEFAEDVYDYTTGLNDNYDNISWRDAKCEQNINTVPVLDTLKFILSLTAPDYITASGKNKKLNDFGLTVSMYTKSTFDDFQKAYEYGQCLVNEVNAGSTTISQSLVTIAYKAILESWKLLEEFTGKADWTTLENYIIMATEILEGPLGEETTNLDTAYTRTSIANLRAATNAANSYKSSYYEAYDTDYQDLIDEQATILYSVISALEFPEGLTPSAIINTEYDGDDSGEYVINADSAYTKAGDSRSYMIITGLAEGQDFTNVFSNNGTDDSIFVATGFTVDGNSNKFQLQETDKGAGTGSYIVGTVNFTEMFRYYAVLYGDLNGDTRIDGTDKTIVNMYLAEDSVETLDKYYQVAADVNCDGTVDAEDIAIINDYYKKVDASGIDQAESPSAAWFGTTA